MKRRNPKKNIRVAIFYSLLIILISPLLAAEIRSNDVWKALYSGRYLQWFHHFPHHSTFTFSPVKDFIARDAFTWLANLAFYNIYWLIGYPGLQLLRVGVLLGTIVLLHSIVDYRVNPFLLVLFVIFSYGLDQKLHLRASFFSIPMTVLVFWIWDRVRHRGKQKCLWLYVPLLMVWSNLHASYLFGLGLITVITVTETLRLIVTRVEKNGNLSSLWIVYSVTVFVTIFVKPFRDRFLGNQFGEIIFGTIEVLRTSGIWEAILFLLSGRFLRPGGGVERNFFVGKGGYSSLLEYLHLPLVQFSLMFIVLGIVAIYMFRERWTLTLLSLFFVVLPFGLSYTRTVAYLPLCIAPMLMIVARKSDMSERFRSRMNILGMGLLTVFVVVFGYQVTKGSVANLTGNPRLRVGLGKSSLFSDKVPDFILRNYREEEFLNPWGEGTYLIWKWWPYKKVYVDSKAVPYTNAFLRRFDSEWVIRWAFNHVVLWKHRPKSKFYQKSPEWRMLAEDEAMVAFQRVSVLR